MGKLQIKNIDKSFNKTDVLKNISFCIEDGEILSLLGPSGCGKSTTLKIIAGLIEPDGGDIVLEKKSLLKIPTDKRKIVIVFQDHLLFPHLNVEDNIGFGLRMARAKKELIRSRVLDIMKLLELSGLERRFPKELSGGQKQRVALGRALAVEPKVLLLDEPFSNLDIRLRDTMRELILDIQKKLNITTILVTHDKDEALMMSDKVAVMINGSVVQYGTPENIYEKPVNRLVADFFGKKNYIEGFMEKGIFKCDFGSFKATGDACGSGELMVKPEDIKMSLPADMKLKGTVKRRKYLGDKIQYTVLTDIGELIVILNNGEDYRVGQKVGIYIDFSKGIFYPKSKSSVYS